jgi:hypothetical protein
VLDYRWTRVERKLQIAAVLHLFYSSRCWVCSNAFRIGELYWKGKEFCTRGVGFNLAVFFPIVLGVCVSCAMFGALSIHMTSSRRRSTFALFAIRVHIFSE